MEQENKVREIIENEFLKFKQQVRDEDIRMDEILEGIEESKRKFSMGIDAELEYLGINLEGLSEDDKIKKLYELREKHGSIQADESGEENHMEQLDELCNENERLLKEEKAVKKIEKELNKELKRIVTSVKKYIKKIEIQIGEEREKIEKLREEDRKIGLEGRSENEIDDIEAKIKRLEGFSSIALNFLNRYNTIEKIRHLIQLDIAMEKEAEEKVIREWLGEETTQDEGEQEKDKKENTTKTTDNTKTIRTKKNNITKSSTKRKEPAKQEPAKQQPVRQQPARQQPVRQEPVKQEPAKQEPAKQQPVRQQPARQQPVRQEPVKQEPAKQQPARQQPVRQQPARQQPVRQEPVKQEPVKQQPAKQEPAKQQPVKQPSNLSYKIIVTASVCKIINEIDQSVLGECAVKSLSVPHYFKELAFKYYRAGEYEKEQMLLKSCDSNIFNLLNSNMIDKEIGKDALRNYERLLVGEQTENFSIEYDFRQQNEQAEMIDLEYLKQAKKVAKSARKTNGDNVTIKKDNIFKRAITNIKRKINSFKTKLLPAARDFENEESLKVNNKKDTYDISKNDFRDKLRPENYTEQECCNKDHERHSKQTTSLKEKEFLQGDEQR